MTVPERIIESCNFCRADLARVADELKWALEPGLSRAGRGLTAPRGAALPREEDSDPDHVEGPKFALDIGDPTLRSAFIDGVNRMAVAELRLALTVTYLDTSASQPPLVRPHHMSSFAVVDICRRAMERRLTIIERDLDLAADLNQRRAARHLHGPVPSGEPVSARKALDLAVRRFNTVFSKGRDLEGVAVPRCRVCGIRPKADKTGGRCNTCHTWFQRNEFERPVTLDSRVVEEATRAKTRRQARGEDWGIG